MRTQRIANFRFVLIAGGGVNQAVAAVNRRVYGLFALGFVCHLEHAQTQQGHGYAVVQSGCVLHGYAPFRVGGNTHYSGWDERPGQPEIPFSGCLNHYIPRCPCLHRPLYFPFQTRPLSTA